MRSQTILNTVSCIAFSIIFGILIYLPSERSNCCKSNDWRLFFLWVETCILILSFLWIIYCLFLNITAEKSKRPIVLVDSIILFEIIILSFFLLCVISSNTVLVGIAIYDSDESPISHLTPKLLLRILRTLIAALLTLWIIVYDMKYPSSEPNFTKCLRLRKCMHAFLTGVIFVQALRFAALVLLWPSAMKDILEKTNKDALYVSITIPASNMFWLKCFLKFCQDQPEDTSHDDHDSEHSDGYQIVEGRNTTSTAKQPTGLKLGCAIVIALILVGVMYGTDLLDTSKGVNTKCVYGLFRIITPVVIGILIVGFYVCHANAAPMATIHFHGSERYVLFVFFLMKMTVNVLNSIWFYSPDHPDGDCKTAAISMTAQIIDGLFNVIQFWCLFFSYGRNRLQCSLISYFLLIAMNFGLIWFDLSIEVWHLQHYTHDYDHLSTEYIFLIIQAVFWIGLEFHVAIVELLIIGCLKPHQREEH